MSRPQLALALAFVVVAACAPPPVSSPDASDPIPDAGGVACTGPSTCPGEDTDCRVRSCDDGVCGFLNLDEGTPVATQADGDCRKVVCDGAGVPKVVNDDGDLPAPEGECLVGRCSGGLATQENASNGNDCGTDGFCSVGACVQCVENEDCEDLGPCADVACVEGACVPTAHDPGDACPEGVCDGTGQCVECVSELDCETPENPCLVARCTETNSCIPATREAGFALEDPAGNCFRSECNTEGEPTAVVDTNDPLVDGNACTTDACLPDGTRLNAPVSERTPCGDGGLCRVDGICVACLDVDDCPGEDTPCSTRACNDGQCVVTRVEAGQPPLGPPQPTNDCRRFECDVDGEVLDLPDDSETPTAPGECFTAACSAGQVVSTPRAPRQSCTSGLCDGAGACVSCLVASDCPGTDGECRTRTCVGHVCGVSLQPDGFVLASQVEDDCGRRECDGQGNPEVVADPSDPFVDGNACTTDACNGTTRSNPPVAARSPCPLASGSGLCNTAGTCVACILNSDCANGGRCEGGVCAAPTCSDTLPNGNETGVDCGGPDCGKCADGGGCNDANDCQSSVCSPQGTCNAPTCQDTVRNGTEDGVDCGGVCPTACRRVMAVAAGASGAIAASWVPGTAWNVTLVDTRSTSRPGLAFKSSTEAMALFRFTQVGHPDDQGIFQLPWTQLGRFGPLARIPNVLTRGSTPIVSNGTGYVSVHHGGSSGDFDYWDLPLTQSAPGNATALGTPGSTDPSIAQSGTETGLLLLREFNNRVAFVSRTNGTWGALQDNLASDPLIPGNVASRIPPALAGFGTNDFVGVYVASSGNRLRFLRRTSGTWSAPADVPDAFTPDRPVLVSLGTTAVGLAFRGNDQNLYFSRYDGSAWSAPGQVTTNIIGVPAMAPGFGTASVDLLFIASTGELFHTRRVGTNWNAPIFVGGANLLGVAAASVVP